MANRDPPALPPARAAPNCSTCYWRSRSEWRFLNDVEIQLLDRTKLFKNYKAEEIIFREGEPCSGIHCVSSGAVAIQKTDPQGNSIHVRIRHSGEKLNYEDFFSGARYTVTAEAIQPSDICSFDRTTIQRLLHSSPALSLAILQLVSQDLQNTEQSLFNSTLFPVRDRLVHFLMRQNHQPVTGDDGNSVTLELPTTRRNIAKLLRTTPETITRTFRALENDGVIRFLDRRSLTLDLHLAAGNLTPGNSP